MQDRYTGDIGDFGKYGLLRELCGMTEGGRQLSLGIVWYRVPDESHNDDGKHTRYLEPSAKNLQQFRALDTHLYDALAKIVRGKDRRLSLVRGASLFPRETAFYETALTFLEMPGIGPAAKQARMRRRARWLSGAIDMTTGRDIVFVDPDNGLEVTVQAHEKTGPKYVYYDELVPFAERGQSLIIYHHIGRKGSAATQINERLSEIADRIEGGTRAFALHYHRGTARAFFVVPAASQRDILTERSHRLVESGWGAHFDLVEPQSQF